MNINRQIKVEDLIKKTNFIEKNSHNVKKYFNMSYDIELKFNHDVIYDIEINSNCQIAEYIIGIKSGLNLLTTTNQENIKNLFTKDNPLFHNFIRFDQIIIKVKLFSKNSGYINQQL